MTKDLIKGLVMLEGMFPDLYLYAEHDIIITSINFVTLDERSSEGQVLRSYGWFISSSDDNCWAKFV